MKRELSKPEKKGKEDRKQHTKKHLNTQKRGEIGTHCLQGRARMGEVFQTCVIKGRNHFIRERLFFGGLSRGISNVNQRMTDDHGQEDLI